MSSMPKIVERENKPESIIYFFLKIKSFMLWKNYKNDSKAKIDDLLNA